MQNELEKFFAAPSARRYLRLRQRMLEGPARQVEPRDLIELQRLLDQGAYQRVCRCVEQMLPAWALAPRLYWFASAAALQMADSEAAEVDRFIYDACLQGILQTGDGSAESPWVITYRSDELDVLERLGLTGNRRRLTRLPQGLCDIVSCAGGANVCFLMEGLPDSLRKIPARLPVWDLPHLAGTRQR